MTRTQANAAILRAAEAWAKTDGAWVAVGSPAKAANATQALIIMRRKEAHADLLNAASALIPTDKGNNAK